VPTYEYVCDECGAEQDIVQAMTDPTLTICPACDKPALRKVFTNVGVVFKGSGFYRTDSRAKSDSGSGSTASSTPTKTDSSSSTSTTSETKKTESKPKKETKTT
jgi:putative FmdB family regulatory protein